MSTKKPPLVERQLSRAQRLALVTAPPSWAVNYGAPVLGMVAAAAGLAAGSYALSGGDVTAGLAYFGAGLLVGTWSVWMYRRSDVGALSFGISGAGLPVLAAATGHVGLAWLAGLATAALVAGGVADTIRRTRLARAVAHLGRGLDAAVNLEREVERTMTPRWLRARPLTGLPTRWLLPPGMPTDDRTALLLAHRATTLAGVPAKIRFTKRYALISALPDGDVLAPLAATVDPEVQRVAAPLSKMIPGARVTKLDYDDDGRFTRLEFSWPSEQNDRVAAAAYRGRVLRVLSATYKPTLSGDPTEDARQVLTAAWDMSRDRAIVTPQPALPDVARHPARRPDDNQMGVAFGVFRNGDPCIWDLNSTLPHVLIVGGTGGGKTVLLTTLLSGLPESAQIYPVDPKRVGLRNMHLIPGGHRPATTPAAFVDTLEHVQGVMDERYEALENEIITRAELEPVVLVIDEGEEMRGVLKEWWVSGEGKVDWMERKGLTKAPTGTEHPAMYMLGSILRLGREARVHVILASQSALAEWLPTSARGQFAVRISLRNLSASDSNVIFGTPIASAGLENLPGRAWVQTGMGTTPQHAQIYWTPKIEKGLSDADRAILHGRGITPPDELTAEQLADLAPAAASTTKPATAPTPALAALAAAEDPHRHLHAVPTTTDLEADEETDDDEFTTLPNTTDEPVAALEDGAQILVTTEDAIQVLATVESVDPDETDPAFLVVTYRLVDSGELGALSLADDETVPVIAA